MLSFFIVLKLNRRFSVIKDMSIFIFGCILYGQLGNRRYNLYLKTAGYAYHLFILRASSSLVNLSFATFHLKYIEFT